ncbi:hypothetical protein [Desulfosporosinus sp. BG]|uniref:hypothetical protein n=1 Tax=Desulfosporosinus sp. BG TaxID=1633135 RepID=UPI00083AC205|nr:hypothetical protein [Desulfosporosinus sp. BG]ODA38741.1 hypothetical protein DSBG_4485 [Desulfosporosinus sp. BG]
MFHRLPTTLEGTIVDYIETKTDGGFEIRKPKTDHAEGCGGVAEVAVEIANMYERELDRGPSPIN